ncbi:MAG TPA: hypothetical protein VF520_09410 [Thermoleophilaceae bacterium]
MGSRLSAIGELEPTSEQSPAQRFPRTREAVKTFIRGIWKTGLVLYAIVNIAGVPDNLENLRDYLLPLGAYGGKIVGGLVLVLVVLSLLPTEAHRWLWAWLPGGRAAPPRTRVRRAAPRIAGGPVETGIGLDTLLEGMDRALEEPFAGLETDVAIEAPGEESEPRDPRPAPPQTPNAELKALLLPLRDRGRAIRKQLDIVLSIGTETPEDWEGQVLDRLEAAGRKDLADYFGERVPGDYSFGLSTWRDSQTQKRRMDVLLGRLTQIIRDLERWP